MGDVTSRRTSRQRDARTQPNHRDARNQPEQAFFYHLLIHLCHVTEFPVPAQEILFTNTTNAAVILEI